MSTPSNTGDDIKHPGLDWLQDAACLTAAGDEDTSPATRFFVEAGRVIDAEVLQTCRTCPVRRECTIHAYLGAPDGTMIGAGYFGGFSLGQRRNMTLRQALDQIEREERTTQDRLL